MTLPTRAGRGRLTVGRLVVTLSVALVLTVGVCLLALAFGAEDLDLAGLFAPDSRAGTILYRVRLPRVLLGLAVGAGLSLAGTTLQAILKNPLADPFILGVSGGAALGATVAMTLGAGLGLVVDEGSALSLWAGRVADAAGAAGFGPVALFACAGAVGAVFLTFAIARSAGGAHPHTLLLAGVVFNAFAMAVILFLRTLVSQYKAQEILFWMVGTLGYRPWPEIAGVSAVVLLGAVLLTAGAVKLNLLAVGDAGAAVLGVDVDRARLWLVLVSSVVVGVAVSLSGLVGFVGLMVPHGLRLIAGPDHRLLLPLATIGGGGFLVASDLLARLAFPLLGTEPPVGVVTALLGGPFFLWLMRRRGATP